jgi:hypothetical protein
MRNCTASRRTDFEDTVGNTPWGADIPDHFAVLHPVEVQVLLAAAVAAAGAAGVVVVVVVVVAAAAAAVAVAAAAAGVQVNL